MASTVLPNGIIIPEKYSRDWYNDLYHNWQELDNLLGGGTPKDGTLTIQKNGTTVGTFSANQATNETIDITVPDVNNGTLTIQKNGTTVDTFTANSSTDKTVNISVPTKTSDLTNDSDFVQSSDLSTVATSGSYNDLSNKPTIPSKTSDLTNDSGFITSDNTKIPLAGSNQISGSLIPATDNSIDVGSSTNNIKMLYAKGITIDGTQFLPSDYIPRSGGAVMTGAFLGRNDNASELGLGGGTDNSNSTTLSLFGKDAYPEYGLNGALRMFIRNANLDQLKSMYIYPSGTWTWNGTACQITSDQRLKQQISEIDDALLDAWEDVNLVQFKYNDAVKEKSDNARLHTGYVVQQIDKACQSHGVDVSAYGLYCHEEYPEETEEVEVEQKDGTKTKETKVIREASEHYSLRYTEVYAVECMYLRRCIKQLTARIEELEKGNNTK